MKHTELEERARLFLEEYPGQTPEQAYINGFLAGAAEAEAQQRTVRINYGLVVERFNAICTGFSRVQALSDRRREKVRLRWKEMAEVGDPLEVCQTVFGKMQASAFLRGGNARKWKATFDWLFDNGNNWVKVYEGQYDDVRSGDAKRVNSFWD